MSRILPEPIPLLSINAQSDVFCVKYNSSGGYILSGHADRNVKVFNLLKLKSLVME